MSGLAVPTAVPAQAAERVTAKSLLKKLTVAAETTSPRYDRDLFDHWVMRRGTCNVRETVLIAESRTTARRNAQCTVTKGRWRNEYTGRTLRSVRKIQIDHRVALAEAWRSGASSWTEAQRRGFANDTGYGPSLLAVSARSNAAKSDHDPAEWLPTKGRCTYVARWIAVKYRWDLAVDRTEKRTLTSWLKRCGAARTKVAKPAKGKPEGTNSPEGSPGGHGVAPISEYDCPSSHPIKGNANSMIYHLPDGRYYDVTKPEECFATESAAVAAGYRRSQA